MFIMLMVNKNEDEGDYLQSLFSKPFCERFYGESYSQKPCLKQQQVHKHRHYYHNIIAETNQVVMRKSHIDNKEKNVDDSCKNKQKITPYQSRKKQQRAFAEQVKRSMDQKQRELAMKLETTQKQWLIIKEIQGDLKINLKGNCKQTQKNGLSNLQLAHFSVDEQGKKHSASKLIKFEPSSEGQCREEAKNIKSMMSYYKHKRAIKQMAKFGNAKNLTNFQIEESINLRIQIKSSSKIDSGDDSDPFKNLSLSRKTYKRDKHAKTENCSSEKARVKLVKSMNLKDIAPHSIFLKGILSSNKIGITFLKRHSKTEMRPHRNHHKQLSNKGENLFKPKSFDLSGWQQSFQFGDSVII